MTLSHAMVACIASSRRHACKTSLQEPFTILTRAFLLYLQEPLTILTRASYYTSTCNNILVLLFNYSSNADLKEQELLFLSRCSSTQAIRPVLAMPDTLRDLAWLALRHDVAQSSPCRSLSHALTGPGESIRWWGGRNDIEPCHGCMHRFRFSTARL